MGASSNPVARRDVTVIGAGIVGICCAAYLQREGHAVTVIDSLPPGEACSKGNAGTLAVESVVPNATPGVLWKVPRWLLDPHGPLALRWSYLVRALPWLVRFWRASSPRRVRAVADALAALLAPTFEDYAPLLAVAGLEQMVRRAGMLTVYESESALARDTDEWALMRERGVRCERLGAVDVRRLEPTLAPTYPCAMFAPDVGHVVDPFRLVQGLADRFLRADGVVSRERVTGFDLGPRGPRRLLTDRGRHEVDVVVIAAGAWSRRLATELGSRVPLESERGYHVTLPEPGVMPGRVVASAEGRFVATPMAMGLRLAGTVELAGLEAPPDWRRAEVLVEKGRRLFPGLNVEGASRWMGHRPSLPDTLPVISRSPVYETVFYAFGHGHLGLTMGATTGRLIADLVAGRPTDIDLTPVRVDRF